MEKIKFFLIVVVIAFNSKIIAAEVKQNEVPESIKKITMFDLRIPDKDYTEDLNDKRLTKLKAHRHAAALTLGLAAASFVTAVLAKKNVDDDRAARNGRMDASDAKNFNLHMAVAGATLASYFTTAYLSISAPKAESMEDLDQIKWHKRLAFIHMPAMIIGPALGLKAYGDYKHGKNPSGIGKLHKPVMMLGVASLLGAAFVAEF